MAIVFSKASGLVGSFNTSDWYTFTLAAATTVDLDLAAAFGTAIVSITDGTGLVLSDPVSQYAYSSTAVSGQAGYDGWITAALAPGQYWIDVSSQVETAYTLTATTGLPSVGSIGQSDGGSSLATATPLGVLSGAIAPIASWVGASHAEDTFSFTVTGDTVLTATLSGLQGSAQIMLDGPTGQEIGFTAYGNPDSNASLIRQIGALASGSYTLIVQPRYNNESTGYSLTIDAAVVSHVAGSIPTFADELGTLSATATTVMDSIDTVLPAGWYRFSVTAPSMVTLMVTGLTDQASLTLYDGNDNQIGPVSPGGPGSGITVREVLAPLTTGEYLVEIAANSAGVTTPYQLSATATPEPDAAGGSLSGALVLPALSATPLVYTDYVGRAKATAYYQFNVTKTTQVDYQVAVANGDVSGSVNVQLLNADGSPNGTQYATGGAEPIGSSMLGAGTYVLAVTRQAFSDNNTYTAAFWTGAPTVGTPGTRSGGSSLTSARDVSTLSASATTLTGWVGSANPNDYYRFELNGPSLVHIDASGLSGTLTVRLLDIYGNDLRDESGNSSLGASVADELPPGAYLIDVQGSSSPTGYALSASAQAFPVSGGATFASATPIGTLAAATQTVHGYVGSSEPFNYLTFSVTAISTVTLDLSGVANLKLLTSTNGAIASVNATAGADASIVTVLDPGIYVVYINGFNPSDYTLTATAAPVADPAGASLAAATNFSLNPPPVSNDLFNDGRSAILWRNAGSGQVYEWHVNGATSLSQTSLYDDPTWRVVGTGDFFAPDASGDRGGILWQSTQTGQSVLWRVDGASYVSSSVIFTGLAWQIVGTGDANGDGTTDIFWRNTQSGAVSEWQMANGVATAAQTIYTDPSTTVVGTGDFWGDGHSDLLIRNAVSGQVSIVRLNGFTVIEQDLIFTDPNWAVVGTGDFNGDGTTDILWNDAATGQTVIWLMNGATSLVQTQIFVSSAWIPVAVGDYNGDGRADILWHNSQTGQTYQWLMNGTAQLAGTNLLTDPNWAPIGNGNDSIAVETPADDFNGEGRSGIVWRNADTGQTFLWTMKGFTQEAGAAAALSDPNWEAVASGDFNGDGHADLIFRNRLTGEAQEWQLGGVTGAVQVTAEQTIFTDPSWRVVGTGDFNGDGRSDLVWQNANSGQVYIWLMNGFTSIARAAALSDPAWSVAGVGAFFGPSVSGGAGPSALLLHDAQTGETDIARMNGTQIVARQAIFTDPDWVPVATGDFFGNGYSDIIWRNGLTGQVLEWQMNGFTEVAGQALFTDPDSRVVAAGDYNGDGHADLLTQNVFTGAVTERQFNGFTQVAQQVIFTDPSWSPSGIRRPVASTDLYGAGRSDIVWHNGVTGQVYLWQQDGAASRAQVSLSTDPNLAVVGRGDFFGTGKAALLFDNATTGEITLRQMNGPAVVGTTSLVTNPALQVTATGVDADGTGHVYMRVSGTGEVQDWHLAGGAVTGKVSLYTDPTWVPVATGDFNGDGKTDIVWQNSVSGQISEWLMDGTHPISQTTIGGSPTMQVIGAGDFQGSGLSGLLVRNTVSGEVDEWWMNGATIASVHPLLTDLSSTVVAVGDYNGDGKADFLVRNAATGQVQLWLGDGASAVSKTTIFTDPNWKPVF